MSAFDSFLSAEDQKKILDVMRRVIKAFQLPKEIRDIFETMTHDQQMLFGAVVQLTNDNAVAAHRELERAKRRPVQ
jgi:hypothetical protein